MYRYWVFLQEKIVTTYEGRTKQGGIEEELKMTESDLKTYPIKVIHKHSVPVTIVDAPWYGSRDSSGGGAQAE